MLLFVRLMTFEIRYVPLKKEISIIDNQNYMLKTFMKEIRYYLPYPKKDVE